MNIRLVAALLLADTELKEVERVLKRRNDWRTARKVGDIRETLANELAKEQQGLSAMVAEFRETKFTDQTTQQ